MDLKYDDVFYHRNRWWWGESVDIVKSDGTAVICVKYDRKTFPYTGYICDLSVISDRRKGGLGRLMMTLALSDCRENGMKFARLHVNAKNEWLREWYERLGFCELSRDDNEIEMVRKL